ncbi:FecR domain-containing protein [Reichenbachiella sp. MALMAid0571]|uniref:FecR family protein n=1 Tax=Reichenbachiella sp. MALMAid0571 TaxID=3143939 RepID=UPI0032DEDB69
MEKEEIYNVIARDLGGSPENDDSKEIAQWTESKKSNYLIFKIIRNYFIEQPFDTSSAESFEKLKARIEETGSMKNKDFGKPHHKESKAIHLQSWLKYAAILIMAVGLAWTAYHIHIVNQQETDQLQITTVEKSNPNGRKTTFELPDGTKVNLNAASKLKYIDDVENSKRIVHLSGEAFFDVAEDKTKPFSVVTKGISTTALGTSFNVKAYSDDPLVKVLLMTGKVGVEYLSAKANGLILNPGMGAEYDSNKENLISKDFDFEKEMGWKQGIIVLDRVGLPTVVQELERWYGVKIQIQNKQKAGDWNYSGRFQNESLENVLSTMGHVKGFNYKIDNKTITIIF